MANPSYELPYEKEAQELLKNLKRIFNDHRETIHGVLDLVIDSEDDTIALLDFIENESDDPDDVHDYAMDLFDRRNE